MKQKELVSKVKMNESKLNNLEKRIKYYVNVGFAIGGILIGGLGLLYQQSQYNNQQYQRNMEIKVQNYQENIKTKIENYQEQIEQLKEQKQDYKEQLKSYQENTKKEFELFKKEYIIKLKK